MLGSFSSKTLTTLKVQLLFNVLMPGSHKVACIVKVESRAERPKRQRTKTFFVFRVFLHDPNDPNDRV